MSLFRRLQRWLEDPLRAELEVARRDLAVLTERLHRAEAAFDARGTLLDGIRGQLTDTLRLIAELKRAGFVSEPTLSRPIVAAPDESDEERQVWDAIYQRAPQGSSLAAVLYQHAQQMLAADEPIEHVIGTILEGGTIDLSELEEMDA